MSYLDRLKNLTTTISTSAESIETLSKPDFDGLDIDLCEHIQSIASVGQPANEMSVHGAILADVQPDHLGRTVDSGIVCPPAPALCGEDAIIVNAWLDAIGEDDPTTRSEILIRAATVPAALADYVVRAIAVGVAMRGVMSEPGAVTPGPLPSVGRYTGRHLAADQVDPLGARRLLDRRTG
jgi:hypothetical protein